MKPVICWKRRIKAEDTSEWQQAMEKEVDPQNVVLNEFPGKAGVWLNVYCPTWKIAQGLVKRHGGKAVRMARKTWWSPQEPRAEPLKIGSRIVVVASEKQRDYCRKKFPIRPILLIPADVAFGTGEHPTTAMMLRQLVKLSPPQKNSRFIDLGTGTGILALGALILGYPKVVATDFDPMAIKVARANETLNSGLWGEEKRVQWSVGDIATWKRESGDVVLANLYSGLLLQYYSQIDQLVKPKGILLISGIMRDQMGHVLERFQRGGYKNVRIIRKGKWCCALFLKDQE